MKTLFALLFAVVVLMNARPSPAQAQPAAPAGTSNSSQKATDDLAGLTPEQQALWLASHAEGWVRKESSDHMDGHKSVGFSTWAKNKISVEKGNSGPIFLVMCNKGPHVVLASGLVENNTVRYKLDGSAVVREAWYFSGDSLRSLQPAQLLKKLVLAKTFTIEFSPPGKTPEVLIYNLTNLRELVAREKVCSM